MRASGCLGVAFGLLLLLVDPGEPTAGSSQPKVECICHNGDYVICDWGSEQMPDTNYSFYFWYEGINDPVEECKDYTQMFGLNVACRFSKYKPFNHLRTYINGSQGRIIPTESLLLNDLVRPGPPFNLTFHNLSNHQLLLTWKSPYKRPMCLQHAVSYKSNKDTHWMEHHVNSMAFQIPSVDPEKLYTFYVKSKLHNNCASTKLWSQPSEFVLWGKEQLVRSVLPVSITPGNLSAHLANDSQRRRDRASESGGFSLCSGEALLQLIQQVDQTPRGKSLSGASAVPLCWALLASALVPFIFAL
ncbi:cytokine receptor common subunit gamma isoform X2 [Python bivittatus]|uniref:Cytokine receptor common subunit gamma isoform X2 n=1 Tax=Python bivittatus TaxID=176946 RepID=A0A9F5IP51_PYTBI|nr:cytokine receptor common subunit gamma isoform X2 [Python bivittatus]